MSTELSGDLPAAETTERPRICQAQGCEVDVNPHGRYCRKRRLCPEHLKAPSLCRKKYGNEKWRFCQQCGKLELIGNFDGLKRSCRVQLARRRAANTKGGTGERRRSSATEPTRSSDKTSSDAGSERMSEDGTPVHAAAAAAAAAASGYAADGPDTGPGYAAAAAAAADVGAGIAPAAGLGGYWPAEGQEGGLPSGMELAAFLQQGFDEALLRRQHQQQQQQLLQRQQLLQQHCADAGQLLQQQQQRQQGLFGLQQQQEQVQQAAVGQPAAGLEGGSAALNPAAPRPSQLPGVHPSGSQLLVQLLREQQHQQQMQQMRSLQQQQSNTHEHPDVYSMAALEAGDSSGLASASGDSLRSMQAHQRQQSLQQHSALLPQRRSLDDAQSFPTSAAAAAAVTRSTSTGSFPTGVPASAGLPVSLAPPQPAVPCSLPGLVNADFQFGQYQFMQTGFPAGVQVPSSAPMPLMPVGSGGSGLPGGMNMHMQGMNMQQGMKQLQQLQPQQQQQRQPAAAAEHFGLGAGRNSSQQGWGRAAVQPGQYGGSLSDFEGLEDMIAAAIGGAGGDPSELRSLSAATAQNMLINARQQLQPQLREFDSAPAGLTLPPEQLGAAAACMDTYSDLLALGSMPMGLLEQQQPGYGGMRAGAVSTSAALAGVYGSTGGLSMGPAGQSHALPMTTPAAVAAAISGQGGLLQPMQQAGMMGAGTGAPSYPLPVQQQQHQGGGVMGGQGEQLPLGAAAAGLMVQQLQQSQQQLAAELQALLDGAVSSPLMHN